jgi:hypothetical protein
MIKRLSTAAIGVALVLCATSVQASPYFGFDGRNYGELQKAPNFGRQQPPGPRMHDASDAPRKCLTSAVRAVLDQIEARFGPVRAISTCRPGARIAGSGRISRHASGNAVDFEAGSRKGAIVKWLIANHKNGGTMTYSDMSHIHVDVGQHFVALAAPSGGGGGSRYAGRSSRGDRYAEGYGRGYDRYDRGYSRYSDDGSRSYGRSRRNVREVSYERGSSSGYRRSDGGSQYSGGYATMYH